MDGLTPSLTEPLLTEPYLTEAEPVHWLVPNRAEAEPMRVGVVIESWIVGFLMPDELWR